MRYDSRSRADRGFIKYNKRYKPIGIIEIKFFFNVTRLLVNRIKKSKDQKKKPSPELFCTTSK